MTSLAEKRCTACTASTPVLTPEQISVLLPQLEPGWQVLNGKKLVRTYEFDNFLKPMRVAKVMADVAEDQQHHPDLIIKWGSLKVDVWTHAISGLSEADFILAAKFDKSVREHGIPVLS